VLQQRGAGSWKETTRVGERTILANISNARKGIVLQGRQILLVPIINKVISEKRLLKIPLFGWKTFSKPRASIHDDMVMSFVSTQ
jgi:hypothetical protein